MSDTPKEFKVIEEHSIIFSTAANGYKEILRIGPDGFHVRGKKIPQDEHEAQLVYDTFTEWLETVTK